MCRDTYAFVGLGRTATHPLAPHAIFFFCFCWSTHGWFVYFQRSVRGENTVTSKISYILFFILLFLLFGVVPSGFYIFGAFIALCLLAWDLYFGCPIRLFNSAELEGLILLSLLSRVDLSIYSFVLWKRARLWMGIGLLHIHT